MKKPSIIYVNWSFNSASHRSYSKSYHQLVSKDQLSLDIINTYKQIDQLTKLVQQQTKHQFMKSLKNRMSQNPNCSSKSDHSQKNVPNTLLEKKPVAKLEKDLGLQQQTLKLNWIGLLTNFLI